MIEGTILVGCGNMGYAMLSRWLSTGLAAAATTVVVEPNGEMRQRVEALGITACADASEVETRQNQLVIFAIKPQIIDRIAPQYERFKQGSLYLSIAAGISVATLEGFLGADAAIVRCMPNTPVSIGKGAMATYANANTTPDQAAFAHGMLSAHGEVIRIAEEGLMDAVTALSGSGPAYVFHFMECLTRAGEDLGLPRDVALILAKQTVYGSAALAAKSEFELAELRKQVTSPNGTTAAGLSVLMTDERMQTLVTQTLHAACKRAKELGRGA